MHETIRQMQREKSASVTFTSKKPNLLVKSTVSIEKPLQFTVENPAFSEKL
jgi:hypothetical protein